MKFKEIKGIGKHDAEEKIAQARIELMKENAQVAIGTTPKSPRKIRNLKKSIAKIMTLLNQKEVPNKK